MKIFLERELKNLSIFKEENLSFVSYESFPKFPHLPQRPSRVQQKTFIIFNFLSERTFSKYCKKMYWIYSKYIFNDVLFIFYKILDNHRQKVWKVFLTLFPLLFFFFFWNDEIFIRKYCHVIADWCLFCVRFWMWFLGFCGTFIVIFINYRDSYIEPKFASKKFSQPKVMNKKFRF